ncbi:PIG-X [Xylariaceae sp. FL1272]|nr:PIG-X [Xylariaceae sp. FL1272]
MRQRITFFHRNEHGIDPSSVKLTDTSISGPDLVAAREDRGTLALEELPAELQELLRDVHELHIRWSAPITHHALGPWNSKLPSGLHIFYTPKTTAVAHSPRLCSHLRAIFGDIDCASPSESFTKLPVDRFSHSTAYQYFSPLKTISSVSAFAKQHACTTGNPKCKAWAQTLDQAVSFDFSYDAISHVAKITALWPEQLQTFSVDSHADHRTEVGILTPDAPPSLESHELGVTGLLTVVGEDKKPSPVLFAFPSRHKNAASTFTSTFLTPLGLHPTLQLNIKSGESPLPDASCSLHVYLTLPRTLFADKYQLEDHLFLASKNLTALRYTSQPVDLEAPDYAMELWGSSVLLELQRPNVPSDDPWTAEIPLHLRYLSPEEGGYGAIEAPWPAVFWACNVEEGTLFPNSPFDRANLGYEGLFGPRTMFWHVHPEPDNGRLYHQFQVPVLDLKKVDRISAVTAAVVLLGFAYVVFKLVSVYWKSGHGDLKASSTSEKKKQ